ncbi:OLC1v1026072C1 [Oldenlandia corymbosa var. corymbosa]|uniref:OLC1v1026072C1 n=1 Tax=Oldenlandia corymbosa var. corymbosa TaxID=529605 RepID=A0AAV1C919_OLDCO|nr:OLC1v1026072C1 [Oldenlandia corymbosa var. corymbosa]
MGSRSTYEREGRVNMLTEMCALTRQRASTGLGFDMDCGAARAGNRSFSRKGAKRDRDDTGREGDEPRRRFGGKAFQTSAMKKMVNESLASEAKQPQGSP